MDSDRKPAGNDLSQPEWTFSGDEIEQYLFLIQDKTKGTVPAGIAKH